MVPTGETPVGGPLQADTRRESTPEQDLELVLQRPLRLMQVLTCL